MAAAGSASRDRNLDVLRALAALGVLATHARWLADALDANVWDATLWKGIRMTVYLFFAVSGFLIARPFLVAILEGKALPGIRNYAARRFARIIPAYWVALTVFLLSGLADLATPLGVVDHYLLVHNEVPNDAGTLYPIAWTLGVEATFYLLVPLAARLAQRVHSGPVGHTRAAAVVLLLALASAVLHVSVYTRALPTEWAAVVQYTLPAQFLFFAPGILVVIAEHHLVNARRRALPSLGITATSLAALGLTAIWVASMYLFVVTTDIPAGVSSIGFAIASGLTVVLARCRTQVTSLPGRGLAWLGLVSYGLYLWHWILLQFAYQRWHVAFAGSGFLGWLGAIALLAAATLPVAAASWYGIERPVIRIASRYRARREVAAAPAARVAENPASRW